MNQAGQKLPIDAGILDDTDTLMVFDLDHLVTEQEATPEQIEAMREWLNREGTCLILGPHHDVGVSHDLKQRAVEYAHHRDPLVPRQQRFGQYTRSVMKGLGVPVTNQYGLRPATVQGTKQLQPLIKHSDLDSRVAVGSADVQLPSAFAPLRDHDDRPTRRRFTCSRSSPSICRGRIRSGVRNRQLLTHTRDR